MRRIFSAISVAAALFSCAASSPSVQDSGPGKARGLISEFASEYDALKISGLALALAKYAALQSLMGFAGNDAALASHLASSRFVESNPSVIQQSFEAASVSVTLHLKDVFLSHGSMPIPVFEAIVAETAEALRQPD